MIAKYLLSTLIIFAVTAVCAAQSGKSTPGMLDRLTHALQADDKPFALLIRVHVKPSAEARFEAEAAKAAKASRADEGCLGYDFHRDPEKPGHYILFERWSGLAALRKHLDQPHTKRIQAVFAEISASPRTAEFYLPVGEK